MCKLQRLTRQDYDFIWDLRRQGVRWDLIANKIYGVDTRNLKEFIKRNPNTNSPLVKEELVGKKISSSNLQENLPDFITHKCF